jgi:hypothetical protein
MAMQNCSFLISVLVLILIAILALNEQPVNSHLQATAPGTRINVHLLPINPVRYQMQITMSYAEETELSN